MGILNGHCLNFFLKLFYPIFGAITTKNTIHFTSTMDKFSVKLHYKYLITVVLSLLANYFLPKNNGFKVLELLYCSVHDPVGSVVDINVYVYFWLKFNMRILNIIFHCSMGMVDGMSLMMTEFSPSAKKESRHQQLMSFSIEESGRCNLHSKTFIRSNAFF